MLWVALDLLLRSSVILSAAELLCQWGGRGRPALRHRLRLAAAALVLLSPVLAMMMPQWGLLSVTETSLPGNVGVSTRPIAALSSHAGADRFARWSLWLWVAGVALRLTPLMMSHLRVAALARRCGRLESPEWQRLAGSLRASMELDAMPELLRAPDAVMPLAAGLWRKRIILPSGCDEWSADMKRGVLAHELAHVHRCDVAAQSFALAVASVWWFQPLLLVTIRNMRRDSELACDQMALAAGGAPSSYAAALMNVAGAFRSGAMASTAVIPMASENDLAMRIHALVAPQRIGSLRHLAAICVVSLLTTTMGASAIAIHPKQNIKSLGGTMMRHVLPAALLASAGMSAATISGALFATGGEAVASATATLSNSDTNERQQTTSDGSGRFVFDNLAAGQYILRVDKPGFASLFRELAVKGDTRLEKGLVMTLAPEQQTRNDLAAMGQKAAASQPENPQLLRIGGNSQAAKLIQQVQPIYPAAAKREGVQGTVTLETVLSREGVPQDIRVLSSPSDELSQSALEAVRQWRYSNTLLNGQPVEVLTEIKVNYALSN